MVSNRPSLNSIQTENDFIKLREDGKSLGSIKEVIGGIHEETNGHLDDLKTNIKLKDNIVVSNAIIKKLLSGGLNIKKGDELGYINSLTLPGNRINWLKGKADMIYAGSDVKIKITNGNVIILDGSSEKTVGKVVRGFNQSRIVEPNGNYPSTGTGYSSSPSSSVDSKDTKEATTGTTSTKPSTSSSTTDDKEKTKPAKAGAEASDVKDSKEVLDTAGPVISRTKEGLQHDNLKTGEVAKELSKAEEEKLKKNSFKTVILKDIVDIWVDAANKEASSEFGEMLKIESIFGKTDAKVLTEQIGKVQKLMDKVLSSAYSGKVDDKDFNKIFKEIGIAEKAETSISKIEEIKDIFNNITTASYETDRVKILNLLRTRNGGVTEGNSKMVASKMGNLLLEKNDFSDIRKILDNPKVMPFVQAGSKPSLVSLGIPEDLVDELIEKYKRIESLQTKNKEVFQEFVKKTNPGLDSSNPREYNKKVNEKIRQAVDYTIRELLKEKLMFNKFDNNDSLRNKYPDYSSMVGAGFSISDDNLASAVEIGLILATSFIPIGAGLKAAGLVDKGMKALRYSVSAKSAGTMTRLAVSSPRIAKAITGAGRLSYGFSNIALQGLAFYETSNILHNAMYQKHVDNIADFGGNLVEGYDDTTEIVKSMAFFGVMAGFAKIANFPKIKDLTKPVPEGILKKSGVILIEAGAITVAGVEIEKQFGGDAEYTWAEYIEALMMVGVMKGVYKKGVESKIIEPEVVKEPNTPKKKSETVDSEPIDVELIEKPNFVLGKEGEVTYTGKRRTHIDKNGVEWAKDGDKWIKINDVKALPKPEGTGNPKPKPKTESSKPKFNETPPEGFKSVRSTSDLVTRRDLLNKKISKGGKTQAEIKKMNDEVIALEREIRARDNVINSARESVEAFKNPKPEPKPKPEPELKPETKPSGKPKPKVEIRNINELPQSRLYENKFRNGEYIIKNSKGEYFNLKGEKLSSNYINSHIAYFNQVKTVKKYVSPNNKNSVFIETPNGNIINSKGVSEKFITKNDLNPVRVKMY